jgi:hypothetical protein
MSENILTSKNKIEWGDGLNKPITWSIYIENLRAERVEHMLLWENVKMLGSWMKCIVCMY